MKLSFIVLGLVVGGCAGSREIQGGLAYPAKVERGRTLDIQVIRRETRIELTNTTARTFGKSLIWLNGRFSKEIDGLAVGQTLSIPLKQFKDEFGESFRGGGFFATEKPEQLALAEIQPGDAQPPVMLGLIVVGGEE